MVGDPRVEEEKTGLDLGILMAVMEVAETLVNADAEGRLVPNHAESWTTTDDGLVWRVKFRDGQMFRNGM